MLVTIFDAVIDSLKLLPVLFGTYLLIEYVEHRASDKLSKILSGNESLGSLVGAVLGSIIHGFSVAAANLYSRRVISIGTLVAVFISTSDEAIPILITSPNNLPIMIKLILIKVAIAVVAGLLLDFVFKSLVKRKPIKEHKDHKVNIDNNEHNVHIDHYEITEEFCVNCHCERGIFKASIFHTLNIFGFILLFNLLLNISIYFIGEDNLSVVLLSGSIFQPILAGLIGLIPNCSASVILTQLFITGDLSFGSIVAGLSTGAGLGLLILFKENKDIKTNIKIVLYIFVVATISGMFIQLLS